jgi:hypothetical protein
MQARTRAHQGAQKHDHEEQPAARQHRSRRQDHPVNLADAYSRLGVPQHQPSRHDHESAHAFVALRAQAERELQVAVATVRVVPLIPAGPAPTARELRVAGGEDGRVGKAEGEPLA